jgi:phosphoglycerate dehydrogenase-like enzyme
MRLAIINDYQKLAQGAADWTELGDSVQVDFFSERLTDPAEAASLLKPYDIVVTAREETRFDATLVNALPALKLLVTHGQRNAALDMGALKQQQVTVCGTGYGFPIATVELAWGLILSLVKNIPQEDQAIRNGDWGIGLPLGLTGRTLGIVGLGALGGGVARVAKAFDMNVIAWSENLTNERCVEVGARKVSKQELFAQSDIVSVHLVLSERTRGIVGAPEIALMKTSALLINTARGPVVDEIALANALRSNSIAGAGLDVFDEEPLPASHEFRSLTNTVLMPHVGGRTRENFVARYRDALENVQAWMQGTPLRVLT